jgi:hypothetical protein
LWAHRGSHCGIWADGSLLLVLLFAFLAALLDAGKLVFIDGPDGRVLRLGCFAVGYLADDGVAGIADEEGLGVQLHGGELGEAGVEAGLVERLGVQLLVEPLIETDGAHGFKVAGTRAEGEAV